MVASAMEHEAEPCLICPRRCGARRPASVSDAGPFGLCGMGRLPVVARAALHFWEEPCISGTRGSGAVFFSGCSLGCVFCQNHQISHGRFGREVDPPALAGIYRSLAEKGAHNVNLVNPTHFARSIAESIELYSGPRIPFVYNTGGYDRVETLRRFEGLVDIYLPDLKFMREETARRYAGAPDYFSAASAALLEMCRQIGGVDFDGEGIMRRGVIVRHLVLPGRAGESMEILGWIKENLPPWVMVSLMCQYVPCGDLSGYPEIARRLSRREYRRVVERLIELGLLNGYVQEPGAADRSYIPEFNLEGV